MYSFADFCFVCLIHTRNLVNFSSRDSDEVPHEEKLRYILHELVSFHPKTPKYICTNCLNNLNVIYKFRQKCLQNFVTLNKCIEQIKAKEGYKNLSVTLMSMKKQMIQNALNSGNEKQSKSIEEVFVKSETYNDAKNEENLADNDEENSVGFEIVIKREAEDVLSTENTETSFEQCLQDHNTLVKAELDSNDDNTVDITVNESLVTEANSSKNPTFEYIPITNITGTKHENTPKIFKCKVCSTTFQSLKSLRNHVHATHTDLGFQCIICQKKYMRKMHLTRHLKTHAGVQYQCPICLKNFSQKSNMDIHLKIHNDSRDFECEICKKRFLQKHHLQDHVRLHSGDKNFRCSFCSKSFTQKVNMLQHEKIHEGVRNYECGFCHKKYTQKSNLKTHLLVHNRKLSNSDVAT